MKKYSLVIRIEDFQTLLGYSHSTAAHHHARLINKLKKKIKIISVQEFCKEYHMEVEAVLKALGRIE